MEFSLRNFIEKKNCGKNVHDVSCDPTSYDEYTAMVKTGN